MIEPNEFHAIPLMRVPIDLDFVRDIEDFDGPLLSEFRSSEGETFLYYWCDCSERANRWLVVRTPLQDLFRYLVGRTSLRSLIRECRDGFLYVVDLSGDAIPLHSWFVYANNIPENYLPGPSSFRAAGAGVVPGFQDVYVDQKWDYEQVASYPRKYLQTYAFHSAFGQGGDPSNLNLDYHLTKGWVFHTLFDRMRDNAPATQRTNLEAVAFASPGYLRFSVDSAIAGGVRDSIERYMNNRLKIRRMVEELRSWANGHSASREERMSTLIRQAADAVHVDGLALLNHTNSVENAAKVLASYFGRLEFLATNEAGQTAMLVGLAYMKER